MKYKVCVNINHDITYCLGHYYQIIFSSLRSFRNLRKIRKNYHRCMWLSVLFLFFLGTLKDRLLLIKRVVGGNRKYRKIEGISLRRNYYLFEDLSCELRISFFSVNRLTKAGNSNCQRRRIWMDSHATLYLYFYRFCIYERSHVLRLQA